MDAGSIPTLASTLARVAELVDATDLKSVDRSGRAGSIPAPGTTVIPPLIDIVLTPRVLNTAVVLLTVIWIGSLWTIGLIVAPSLFVVLDDRALAGTVAGYLFTLENIIGLSCGTVLLVIGLYRFVGRIGLLIPAAMMIIILVGQFLIQPQLAELRAAGASGGGDFARLHGISAVLYLLQCLLGLGWVILLGNRLLR